MNQARFIAHRNRSPECRRAGKNAAENDQNAKNAKAQSYNLVGLEDGTVLRCALSPGGLRNCCAAQISVVTELNSISLSLFGVILNEAAFQAE
jgi:hypothetical protein